MFEDIPLIYMSVRILTFWSYIYDHNWRRYLALTASVFLNFTQFLDMFYTTESLDSIIRNAYMLVLWFSTILRAITLVRSRNRYEQFISDFVELYNDIKKNGDAFVHDLLEKANKLGMNMSRLNLFLGLLTSIGFGMYPFFASKKILPFGSDVPGINEYDSPYYEIIYAYQMIITPMGCCMYIPFTNLIVAFIMFGIVMCKSLQYKLRNLQHFDSNRRLVETNLVAYIAYHKKIIRYVDVINELTTYIFLVEFIAFGALLCALLFLLNIINSSAQTIIVCAYIAMIFAQILALYWYANELYEESSNVAIAAYDTNWFYYSPLIQKDIMLIILRSQKPCAVMVGYVYPMTLQTFQSLLNASYTFFTLLRRVYV